MNEGLWIIDPSSGEERFATYDELDAEVLPTLWRPVGHFCYAADAFCRLALPKVPFYIKDLLPKKGKIEIYGAAKVGKSFLSLQLARCIGSGEPFLDIPTAQGRVLYLQFELGQEVLQQRIRSTKKAYEDVYVGTTFSMKLDKDLGRQQLMEAIEGVCPHVVIIDPLYKALAGDENESHDMLYVVDMFDYCIETYGCSFVIIHHSGKDTSKGGRGSSILEDWVDSYIEVKKVNKPQEPFRLRMTPKLLRHAELPPDPIEAELQDFEFVRVEAKDAIKEQIVELLSGSPAIAWTISAIVEQGIGSRASVNRAGNELVEEGLADRLPKGGYIWKGGKDEAANI